ncbi:hypothetical protein OE059_03155 [Exiguobacterium profundum]|uniref:Ig-like domain-containing protein n=1 Tax=Exiguobacterium profundum TaxID=307643 RepID=A0ABY8B160_9BACL|nr:hypothetical protein [Exiguobacterium profundum]WED55871.1 hypothetical protein OE059_03155 [Exiguobacterium profundum]
MAKKKQFVTAAAAFAVAASAVAPAITADAASTTVRLSSDYVRGGDLNAALDKEYKGSEIHWYKSSIDMNKLGVFQTAKGFVKGKGIKVEKKLRVLNYAQEIKPESEFVFEQGVPVSGIRVQPVLFADGVVYNKPLFVAGFSTEKVGEFEGTLTYSNKAYGSVTKTVKYKVVASKVEFSEVKHEVKDDVLSVSADVKNLKEGEKVELVIFPGKDESKPLDPYTAEIKDGKVMVSAKDIPAGTHSFILRSGDVKTEAMNFVVEAPMVKEVKAINATQVEVAFNKAVDAKSLFVDGVSGALKAGVLTFNTIDSVASGNFAGKLSQDGKVLTLTADNNLEKRYDVVIDKVKTVSGADVEKYSKIITIEKDAVAPMITGTERITATKVKVKFSEPMTSAGSTTFKLADGTVVSGISGQGILVDGGMAFELDLSATTVPVGKEIIATVIGAADKAGNLLTPNPATVSILKGDKDGVAPTVATVVQSGAKTIEIMFSEALSTKPTVSLDGVAVNAADVAIDSKDSKKVVVTAPAVLEGDKVVTIAGAIDGSGETQAATNRVVKFVKDAVAPKVVSSAVVVDATDKAEYLELTFDKNVLLAPAQIDVKDSSFVKDFVTTSIADGTLGPISIDYKDPANKQVLRVKLDTLLGLAATDVEGAKYALNYALTGVASEYGVAVTSGTASFTRGKDGTAVNTTPQALADTNAIVQTPNNNDEITVTFKENVDAATATNVANYIVGGAVVESATVNSTAPKAVVLKLKADSNTFTGARNVTVQNVKAAGSTVAMPTTTLAITLKENVAPTATAQLQADLQSIKITFSENVFQTANTTDDFGLFVGTDAYTYDHDSNPATDEIAFTVDSGLALLEASAANTITIALPEKVTAAELTKGLSLKSVTGYDVKDAAGNKLRINGSVAVSNN